MTTTHTVFGRDEPAPHHDHITDRAALGIELLALLDGIDATS